VIAIAAILRTATLLPNVAEALSQLSAELAVDRTEFEQTHPTTAIPRFFVQAHQLHQLIAVSWSWSEPLLKLGASRPRPNYYKGLEQISLFLISAPLSYT
jgi:hypothetical protein